MWQKWHQWCSWSSDWPLELLNAEALMCSGSCQPMMCRFNSTTKFRGYDWVRVKILQTTLGDLGCRTRTKHTDQRYAGITCKNLRRTRYDSSV